MAPLLATSVLTSVLIVDDEPAVRDLMTRWARSLGLDVASAASVDDAMAALRIRHFDLAILDVMMPGRDGLWLARELKATQADTAVVLATAYTDLLGGTMEPLAIADLLVKPFERDRFVLAIDRGRQWRRQAIGETRWLAQLSLDLRDGVDSLCLEVDRAIETGVDEIDALLSFACQRDPAMFAHSERVAAFALAVAREMRADDLLLTLGDAARLHDIGKLAVPRPIATRPSPLTPGELTIMRRHVDAGAEILASTRTLSSLVPLVLASHEWFNGGGYPLGLTGDAIPLGSRIITICDSYDAMTQDRLYRGRMDSKDALDEIVRCTGSQFDPEVSSVFLSLLGKA